MGYYTEFDLDIVDGDFYSPVYEKEITVLADYTTLFEEEHKWYNYEKDMRSYSQRYPNTLFILSGEGEEGGDLWKAYFKNGKMQKCEAKITYDDYNESLLN